MAEPGEKIHVLLVDDHPVVRQGLRGMLATTPDMEVVGEASDGASAVEQIAALRPDVVLLDIRMPGANGIEVTRQARRASPEAKILILTTYDEDEYVLGALQAGAQGYLLKTASREQLISAIRTAHQGQYLLSPPLMKGVLQRADTVEHGRPEAGVHLAALDVQILRLVAEGVTNREIGERLGYSEIAIKRKMQTICARLNVANRAQAVAEAVRRGLL